MACACARSGFCLGCPHGQLARSSHSTTGSDSLLTNRPSSTHRRAFWSSWWARSMPAASTWRQTTWSRSTGRPMRCRCACDCECVCFRRALAARVCPGPRCARRRARAVVALQALRDCRVRRCAFPCRHVPPSRPTDATSPHHARPHGGSDGWGVWFEGARQGAKHSHIPHTCIRTHLPLRCPALMAACESYLHQLTWHFKPLPLFYARGAAHS